MAYYRSLVVDGGLKVENVKLFCSTNTAKTTASQPLMVSNSQDYVPKNASINGRQWETDFYTPPVLGGAALFDNSAPAVYKLQGP